MKKFVCALLAMCLMFSFIPNSANAANEKNKSGYNASAAATYATQHAFDGVGKCAQFVCDSLRAGGITIPNKSHFKTTDASYDNCDGKLGVYVNPYIAAPALLKYLGEVLGYTVIKNPSKSQMELGDVVFMYPRVIGEHPDSHVAIITKVEGGKAYFSAHNVARLNRAVSESWCTYLVKMSDKPAESGTITKTQYRYHIYVNENGKRFVCPYAGQKSYPGTTFKIQYTEWMDEPLEVNNGKYSSYFHKKSSKCASHGCIDSTWEGNRYMDANGLTWVCQETREVEVKTKTQYRYHIYVNENGKRFVCPYAGKNSYPGTTFKIQYTEWLDEPLEVNNGKYRAYFHTKSSRCAAYGCIDSTWEGNRYMDANGLTWVCQETRVVEE